VTSWAQPLEQLGSAGIAGELDLAAGLAQGREHLLALADRAAVIGFAMHDQGRGVGAVSIRRHSCSRGRRAGRRRRTVARGPRGTKPHSRRQARWLDTWGWLRPVSPTISVSSRWCSRRAFSMASPVHRGSPSSTRPGPVRGAYALGEFEQTLKRPTMPPAPCSPRSGCAPGQVGPA
jgi:hypothetical protein